jgi:hypothetical protein
VKRDVREPLLYAGILAVLLGYRVLRAIGRRRAAATRAVHTTSAQAAAPFHKLRSGDQFVRPTAG